MTRFHVEFKERVSTFGENNVRGVLIGNGNFTGTFDYDGDDHEFIEVLLNEDENVVSYSMEEVPE